MHAAAASARQGDQHRVHQAAAGNAVGFLDSAQLSTTLRISGAACARVRRRAGICGVAERLGPRHEYAGSVPLCGCDRRGGAPALPAQQRSAERQQRAHGVLATGCRRGREYRAHARAGPRQLTEAGSLVLGTLHGLRRLRFAYQGRGGSRRGAGQGRSRPALDGAVKSALGSLAGCFSGG